MAHPTELSWAAQGVVLAANRAYPQFYCGFQFSVARSLQASGDSWLKSLRKNDARLNAYRRSGDQEGFLLLRTCRWASSPR
jgi:hypothetical protein